MSAMASFAYFKKFDEVNKLSKFINHKNSYINYDDLLLYFIYDNKLLQSSNKLSNKESKKFVDLIENIYPLIEDKNSFIKFIYSLQDKHSLTKKEKKKCLNLLFKNDFDEISSIDVFAFNNYFLFNCSLLQKFTELTF